MSLNDTVEVFPQVCIIESPSRGDLREGRNGGDMRFSCAISGQGYQQLLPCDYREGTCGVF